MGYRFEGRAHREIEVVVGHLGRVGSSRDGVVPFQDVVEKPLLVLLQVLVCPAECLRQRSLRLTVSGGGEEQSQQDHARSSYCSMGIESSACLSVPPKEPTLM